MTTPSLVVTRIAETPGECATRRPCSEAITSGLADTSNRVGEALPLRSVWISGWMEAPTAKGAFKAFAWSPLLAAMAVCPMALPHPPTRGVPLKTSTIFASRRMTRQLRGLPCPYTARHVSANLGRPDAAFSCQTADSGAARAVKRADFQYTDGPSVHPSKTSMLACGSHAIF
jgi:hypothetical protein